MLLQAFKCDIPNCPAAHTETRDGDGARGWGQLKGVVLNDVADPLLCPKHLGMLAEYADAITVPEAD